MKDVLGIQSMLELYGCDRELLNNMEFIRESMLQAAHKANATIIQQYFHQFSPHGISGTIVIAESHINIHTWPEHDYAAIDIFSCGEQMDIEAACAHLELALKAKKRTNQTHERGSLSIIKKVNDSQTPHHRQ